MQAQAEFFVWTKTPGCLARTGAGSTPDDFFLSKLQTRPAPTLREKFGRSLTCSVLHQGLHNGRADFWTPPGRVGVFSTGSAYSDLERESRRSDPATPRRTRPPLRRVARSRSLAPAGTTTAGDDHTGPVPAGARDREDNPSITHIRSFHPGLNMFHHDINVHARGDMVYLDIDNAFPSWHLSRVRTRCTALIRTPRLQSTARRRDPQYGARWQLVHCLVAQYGVAGPCTAGVGSWVSQRLRTT